MLLRRLWDRWDLGSWIDRRTAEISGHYRPSLMVELWTVLLCYGGGWLDDLKLLAARGVRRLFGWGAVPDPTTFGRCGASPQAPAAPVANCRNVRRNTTLPIESVVGRRAGQPTLEDGRRW